MEDVNNNTMPELPAPDSFPAMDTAEEDVIDCPSPPCWRSHDFIPTGLVAASSSSASVNEGSSSAGMTGESSSASMTGESFGATSATIMDDESDPEEVMRQLLSPQNGVFFGLPSLPVQMDQIASPINTAFSRGDDEFDNVHNHGRSASSSHAVDQRQPAAQSCCSSLVPRPCSHRTQTQAPPTSLSTTAAMYDASCSFPAAMVTGSTYPSPYLATTPQDSFSRASENPELPGVGPTSTHLDSKRIAHTSSVAVTPFVNASPPDMDPATMDWNLDCNTIDLAHLLSFEGDPPQAHAEAPPFMMPGQATPQVMPGQATPQVMDPSHAQFAPSVMNQGHVQAAPGNHGMTPKDRLEHNLARGKAWTTNQQLEYIAQQTGHRHQPIDPNDSMFMALKIKANWLLLKVVLGMLVADGTIRNHKRHQILQWPDWAQPLARFFTDNSVKSFKSGCKAWGHPDDPVNELVGMLKLLVKACRTCDQTEGKRTQRARES
eukprot:TRINITY_DN9724_c0_g1_i1.p1 TRINITY_DN9724_c0_g1~~TRINITY_DN9724_c0_g1_i1.p1  ORF type:complete len:490 (+),score=67.60 TRINITY_DN9724_c0_g1_i1:223-1692(+)